MSHKSAFQSWTRFDQNRIFFHISISCLNWDWGKVKNEKRREGDKAADLNFAWSSFLLFFSPSSYEKKVGRWSVANECKVLIPLQFSLMMNTMPTGQIFFKSMMFFCKEKRNEWIPLQQQYLFTMVFLAYREQRTNFISVTVFTSCGIKEVLCWYFRVRWVVEFLTWGYNINSNL